MYEKVLTDDTKSCIMAIGGEWVDFYGVIKNIKMDEFDEEIYTEEDDECKFEDDLTIAIQDECGFNDKQCMKIYGKAYQETHSGGYESIVNHAKELAYFCREIMNLETK